MSKCLYNSCDLKEILANDSLLLALIKTYIDKKTVLLGFYISVGEGLVFDSNGNSYILRYFIIHGVYQITINDIQRTFVDEGTYRIWINLLKSYSEINEMTTRINNFQSYFEKSWIRRIFN